LGAAGLEALPDVANTLRNWLEMAGKVPGIAERFADFHDGGLLAAQRLQLLMNKLPLICRWLRAESNGAAVDLDSIALVPCFYELRALYGIGRTRSQAGRWGAGIILGVCRLS
jgi:hypothetical protein